MYNNLGVDSLLNILCTDIIIYNITFNLLIVTASVVKHAYCDRLGIINNKLHIHSILRKIKSDDVFFMFMIFEKKKMLMMFIFMLILFISTQVPFFMRGCTNGPA